jgi:putative hydrolase of the HAD superfamily
MRKLKHLILDLGGVLIDDFDAAPLKLIPKLNIKKTQSCLAVIEDMVDNGKRTFKDYVNEFNRITGLKYSVEDYQRQKHMIVRFNHELIKFCKSNKNNFKVSILSDNNRSNVQYYNRHIALNKWTYKQVYSYYYKVTKPNSKIYKILLKKIKAHPGECIFVDDWQDNVAAAKKLGIKAVLFKGNKKLIPMLRRDFNLL